MQIENILKVIYGAIISFKSEQWAISLKQLQRWPQNLPKARLLLTDGLFLETKYYSKILKYNFKHTNMLQCFIKTVISWK